MPYNIEQSSFAGGYISPSLYGATSTKNYKAGISSSLNMINNQKGYIEKRLGTEYITHDNLDTVNIQSFYFYETADNFKMLVFNPSILIIYQFTNGVFASRTSVVSPYLEDEIKDIQGEQSPNGDEMFFVHSNHIPQVFKTILEDMVFYVKPTVFYANNYPSCLTFFQGRLWVSGVPTRKNTIFGSRQGRYTEFYDSGSIDDVEINVDPLYDYTSQIDNPSHIYEDTYNTEFKVTAKTVDIAGITRYSSKDVTLTADSTDAGAITANISGNKVDFTIDDSAYDNNTYFWDFGEGGGGVNTIGKTFPVSFTLDEVNTIVWIKGASSLFVGTKNKEYIITSGNTSSPIVWAGSISIADISTIGSCNIQPLNVSNTIYFVNKGRDKLYSIGAKGQVSNTSIFYDDLLIDVIGLAVYKNDDVNVDILLADGTIIRNNIAEVGSGMIIATGDIATYITAPSSDTFRSISILTNGNLIFGENLNNLYIDLITSITPTTSIVLDTIHDGDVIIVQGSNIFDGVVNLGSLTLDSNVILNEPISIGYLYNSEVSTLPIVTDIKGIGSTRPNKINIINVFIMIANSSIPNVYGMNVNTRDSIVFGSSELSTSGIFAYYGMTSSTNNGLITISSNEPLPLKITSITLKTQGGT